VIPFPTSAPPCHASELRISQGRGGAAAGTLYQRLVFTNIGRRTCPLRGYPTITALGPDGRRRTLHPHPEGFTFFHPFPTSLPPGGHSFIDLATSDGCDNALNCDSVQAIAAHKQIRYAMQLTVPSRAAAGFAKFSWSLNNPHGPFAGRIIQVTRR
jgi:hypothetical protein